MHSSHESASKHGGTTRSSHQPYSFVGFAQAGSSIVVHIGREPRVGTRIEPCSNRESSMVKLIVANPPKCGGHLRSASCAWLDVAITLEARADAKTPRVTFLRILPP